MCPLINSDNSMEIEFHFGLCDNNNNWYDTAVQGQLGPAYRGIPRNAEVFR